MRHRKQKGKLSRSSSHRKALMMNLSREVIEHERIQTSEAKAKAVKPELERLITLARRGDAHSRRTAMARLGQDKFVVYKLFEELAPRYADREGGYTRILKLAPRGRPPPRSRAGPGGVRSPGDVLPRAGLGGPGRGGGAQVECAARVT